VCPTASLGERARVRGEGKKKKGRGRKSGKNNFFSLGGEDYARP